MDGKKVIIIGASAGIGKSVREAIALSKLENSGFEVVEFNPEKREVKELADQLKSIVERERGIVIKEQETYIIEKLPDLIRPSFLNQKIRSKYKRNLKYR